MEGEGEGREWVGGGESPGFSKKMVTLLDLCVSSLRRGHANLLCIVPILTDDPEGNPMEDKGERCKCDGSQSETQGSPLSWSAHG